MSEKPKRKTSPITQALLIITLAALVALSVYYVFGVYIPAQNQAATINSTIEEQR